MTKNKRIGFSALALLLVAGASACSDDDDEGDSPMAMGGMGGMGMAGGAGMAGMPMAGGAGMGGMGMTGAVPGALGPSGFPSLGNRIDRAGRVAVTAALIGAFNADPAEAASIRDTYNEGGQVNAANLPELTRSLGILDGLDGECGNQLLAGTPGPGRYDALAGILNDDSLYVNSSRGNCEPGFYLGVEAEVAGALPEGGGSCGGRLPGDDVIERSYSVLAAGALSGVDDGVASDSRAHSASQFPFLGAP